MKTFFFREQYFLKTKINESGPSVPRISKNSPRISKNSKCAAGGKKVENHRSGVLPQPTDIMREEVRVFAEFKVLFAQLYYDKPKSIDKLSFLKAKLNELAHNFCGSLIDVTKFPFDSVCL